MMNLNDRQYKRISSLLMVKALSALCRRINRAGNRFGLQGSIPDARQATSFANRFSHWLWPGLIAALFIILVALAAFNALWRHAEPHPWYRLLTDRYLWYVLSFTVIQAVLSVWLTTLPAIALARALYRRHFPGRTLLLRFCAMTLVLPVLVGIFGIISVFGHQGWLAHLCTWLHLHYSFSPYGLGGILLAHVFFNLPLATRLLLQALENIPVEQRQLAAQLNMSAGQFLRLVEWPYLRRQLLPTAALIFILCFSSFVTVLALGGGPRATTIALAIYQALSYDLDAGRAALLALLQIMCCLSFTVLSQHLASTIPVGKSQHARWRDQRNNLVSKITDSLIILAAMLILLPPLLAVVCNGINPDLPTALIQTELWQALLTSLLIAIAAGLLCLLLTMMLLWSSRELRLQEHWISAKLLNLIGMLILAIPSIVLATGFFLLSGNNDWIPFQPAPMVILGNALMAIPYALKVLESPMQDVAERYNLLCLSLNITGCNRLLLVEWRTLRHPVGQAMAFACMLSLGDFGITALFGNQDFRTLPLYLYQQIGAYRSQGGAVTALLLLLFCLLLSTIIEKLSGPDDKIR